MNQSGQPISHLGDTTLEAFLEAGNDAPVVAVMRTLFADSETPMGLYRKLSGGPGSFLLESADQAGKWSRYSFIGASSHGVLTESDGHAQWDSLGMSASEAFGGPVPEKALDALEALDLRWASNALPAVPPFSGGLVGYIGWDAVRELEHLPHPPRSVHPVPRVAMALTKDLVVFDHHSSDVILLALVYSQEPVTKSHYTEAVARLDSLHDALRAPTASTLSTRHEGEAQGATPNMTREQFHDMVARAKQHIVDGDVFQVVVGQRFDAEVTASALEVYRVLRSLNPSPYMYLLESRGADGVPFHVVGSSPEALVSVKNNRVYSHPIAGSRPRGDTPERDAEIAHELAADQKEQAEHLMLVDLARNDLSRVCVSGSVDVTEFMEVERFSHIMHLVSSVEGQKRPDASLTDVLRATFPAGTLSGAPKPRALEIIDDLEPDRRGVYGGVVGYFAHRGDADVAIAIRTVWMREGVATVQAGAGIVADSDPESEYQETHHKAAAPLRAVATANALQPDTQAPDSK
ncbi:anthranilate synthase component 1 [Pontimonas salivibrio]|uniref:Anthranilate synthase component 1 n=1 Tax=Pontimonas salivibrio TaxID=1159327 RepID=A0A2L2BQW4_9MICO|nr:anthranilate synthase component I [Pontimonas salivibrio]AVG24048.1 anthranilate synthase component 1 [Pontimonas salivibrio]